MEESLDGDDGGRSQVTTPPPVNSSRGFRAPGTTTMVVGGLVGAILAYVFQAVGTRTLGDAGFAPIAAIWTAFFILASVLLVPLEQYVTREVSRGRSARSDRMAVAVVGLVGAVGAVAFVLATLDRFFDGKAVYAVIMAGMVLGYTLLFTAKGVLAGNRRFAGVGWVLAIEGMIRLGVGLAVVAVVVDAVPFAWAMVAAPLSAVLLRFWRYDRTEDEVESVGARRFLGGYVGASSASQLLLAGPPLAAAALGGSNAVFSVLFTTFTLFRAPLTLIYSLQSRILPHLVAMAGDDDRHGLRRIASRVVGVGAILTVCGAFVGWLVGPDVVSLAFGDQYRPDAVVAMLTAGGVMAASTAQIGGQFLVARARTATLAGAWVVGLGVAILVMLVASGEPAIRVAYGFAAGEISAMAGVGLLILRS